MIASDDNEAELDAAIVPGGGRVAPTTSAPWLNGRDIAVIGLGATLGLMSWLSPETAWAGQARKLARWRTKRQAVLSDAELATMRAVVGERPARWLRDHYWPSFVGHKYHAWMHVFACYPPKRWQPRPRLEGREHLQEALAAGRGAVLWNATFAFRDVMTHAALAGAGYRASYLSQDTHGFSETGFGRRWLNPIYIRTEQRFLGERLAFSGDRTETVRQDMRSRLMHNQLVLALVSPTGRRSAVLPFRRGKIRIATGLLNLALETGAAVLPVFTICQADGRFVTTVEPALAAPAAGSRGAAIEAMLRDYLPRLDAYVGRYPDQFSYPLSAQHGVPLIEPRRP